MTSYDSFDTCIAAFADALGVTLPERADNEAAVFSIDGTEVSLRESADGGTIIATAGICEAPPDAKGVFSSLALQANFTATGGMALSLDAETGELNVSASLPLALADPDALSAAVESLVNTAEEWRRNAVAFLDVDEEAAIMEADEADASPISGDPGFIRV